MSDAPKYDFEAATKQNADLYAAKIKAAEKQLASEGHISHEPGLAALKKAAARPGAKPSTKATTKAAKSSSEG